MPDDYDDHGQPSGEAINWKRREDVRFAELIGLCRGVLADGILVPDEARFVYEWLHRNPPVLRTIFGAQLDRLLQNALADNLIAADEEEGLVDLILKIVGGTPPGPSDSSFSTRLPVDEPPPSLVFQEKCFCFTGKFDYGKRSQCEEVVISRGGRCKSAVTRDVDFLVIGNIGSRDWVQSALGRKIERAIQVRNEGFTIKIVSESHFVSCLTCG